MSLRHPIPYQSVGCGLSPPGALANYSVVIIVLNANRLFTLFANSIECAGASFRISKWILNAVDKVAISGLRRELIMFTLPTGLLSTLPYQQLGYFAFCIPRHQALNLRQQVRCCAFAVSRAVMGIDRYYRECIYGGIIRIIEWFRSKKSMNRIGNR